MSMKRFVAGVSLLFLTAVAGCGGDSPTAPAPTATGTWAGTMHGADIEGITLSLTLVENAGSVTGSAQLGGTNVPKSLVVTGTFASPSLSITMTQGGLHPPANLTGTINGSTLTAFVNGSGFSADPITMTRQ
jgi:hypothetical protein